MGIFKDENGNSYGDWTHRGQGASRENANDIVGTGRREEVVRPDLLDHLLPRGAVARGARAHVARRLHVARGGEDRRDHRAGGRGGAVLPDVPGRDGCSRDDGDIASRSSGRGHGIIPRAQAMASLGSTVHWAVPFAA
ncbi:MAG: hypothetical protein ACLTDR_12085 [Adlercreutzia equolifaciens]